MQQAYAVMECDEGWTRRVLPAMHRGAFLVTNIFRVSRPLRRRFGTHSRHPGGVAGSTETTLGLNPTTTSPPPSPRMCRNPSSGTASTRAPGKDAVPRTRSHGLPELRRRAGLCLCQLRAPGGWRCRAAAEARTATDVGVAELLSLGLDGASTHAPPRRDFRSHRQLPALYKLSKLGTIAARWRWGSPRRRAKRASRLPSRLRPHGAV
jgi:hypothetical protein